MKYSEKLKELIDAMLDLNPKMRPTVQKILRMDFIKNFLKLSSFRPKNESKNHSKYQQKLKQFLMERKQTKSAKVSQKKITNKKQFVNSFRLYEKAEPRKKPQQSRFGSKSPARNAREPLSMENAMKKVYIKNRREKISKLKLEAKKIQRNEEQFQNCHRLKPPGPVRLRYFTKKSSRQTENRLRNKSERTRGKFYSKKKGGRAGELGFQSKSTKMQRSATPESLSNYMDLHRRKRSKEPGQKKAFFFFQKKFKDNVF